MPILDIQRKLTEVGRLRLGHRVGRRAVKGDTWRMTSPHRAALEQAAGLWGGTVEPWPDAPGRGTQFQLTTDTDALPVLVPPSDATVDQWYELWSGKGGLVRRCDGQTELTGACTGCACLKAYGPAGSADRLAAQASGQACRPTTRLRVMLADVAPPGLWRLDSHGYYAAVELPGQAELLARVNADGHVPATLRIEQRTVIRGRTTQHFATPVLDIGASVSELSGAARPAPAPALSSGRPRSREIATPDVALPGDGPTLAADSVVERFLAAVAGRFPAAPEDAAAAVVAAATDGRTRDPRAVHADEVPMLSTVWGQVKNGTRTLGIDADGRYHVAAVSR